MKDYTFQIINRNFQGSLPDSTREHLRKRPYVQVDSSLAGTAGRYRPSQELENAINTAIAIGEPLLLTGEPGTGKTQAAYFVAQQLNVNLFHFQAKSNSTANNLLYEFDTVRYFHDAHLDRAPAGAHSHFLVLDKRNYVEKRPLWLAFEEGLRTQFPAVLLIDEIDKTPRDFPNDLLHEVDQMEFVVSEIDEKISCPRELRPLLFITSNDERRLPPAFLRRCVTHHIELTEGLLSEAVESHQNRYPKLNEKFLETAIQCFVRIRRRAKEKPPATGELLAWLQVLSVTIGSRPDVLNADLKDLPYLGTLIKHPEDMKELKNG